MDPGANDWDLVIKVKYGDTLRRFGAYVHARAMDHNMSEIRGKIISLFKFNPNAALILTYTDKDGDVVTLDDDDELCDAVISQRLNPLRINVQLNTCGSSDPKSQTINFTQTGSRQFQTGPPQIGSSVDETLNSVPEPFRAALSKLSQDLLLKAASSAPALAEFVECFSKFVLSDVNLPSHGPVSELSGTSNTASTSLMDLRVTDEPKVTSDPVPVTIVSATISSGNPVPEHIPKQNGSVNVTQSPGVTAPTYVDLNLDPPRNPHTLEFPSINDLLSCTWTTNYNVDHSKEGVDTSDAKSDLSAPFPAPPIDQTVEHNSRNLAEINSSVTPNSMYGVAEVSGDDNSNQFPISATPSHVRGSQFDVHDKSNINVPPPVPIPMSSFLKHPYRKHNHHNTMHRTFHRGVRCDGCGMYPITGPRFKSNVKVDYDLCSYCFVEVGNEADYTRIERAPYHSYRSFKEFSTPHYRYGIPSLRPFHGCGVRTSRAKLGSSSRAKLESIFIQDVTVLDGTVMPPCTPFTKIWRMRNNGTIAWPFGTQLVWTGGNPLGNRGSAELEVPLNGCPVGEEIDIAVDFTAPSTPGSYISLWKMASPSGQKFGEKIWVQIEVENPQPNSAADGFHGVINLNLPPESSGRNGLGIIDVNTEPLDGASPKSIANIQLESLVNSMPSMNVEPVVANGLLGASDGRVQLTSKLVPVVQYPIIDFPESSSNAAPVAYTLQSNATTNDNPVEQTLLDGASPKSVAKAMQESLVNAMSSSNVEAVMANGLPGASDGRAQLMPKMVPLVQYPIIDFPESSNPAAVSDTLQSIAATDDNPFEQTLLKELEEMGFKQIDLNKEVLRMNEYDLEQSVDDLCGFTEWDPLLVELQEMGFHDKELNKKLLVKNGGSIKRAVLDLIAGEKD